MVVGTNLSPLEITLTWLSVSWRLEKFQMNLSFDFLSVAIRFLTKCTQGCLRLMLVLNPVLFWAPLRWFDFQERDLFFSISLLFADHPLID